MGNSSAGSSWSDCEERRNGSSGEDRRKRGQSGICDHGSANPSGSQADGKESGNRGRRGKIRPADRKPSDRSEEAEGLDKKEKEAVKANVLELLKKYYDMEEEDFFSAELEIVPAGKARDCGLDRSMVLAYGQDDRVCAFTSLFAMLDVEKTERTACCILVDKEEIGSVGATGMHSRFFENIVAELAAPPVHRQN